MLVDITEKGRRYLNKIDQGSYPFKDISEWGGSKVLQSISEDGPINLESIREEISTRGYESPEAESVWIDHIRRLFEAGYIEQI